MKVRTVLYADEGMVLTDGTDYGTVIWLAEGINADTYRAISRKEYDAILAKQQMPEETEI